MSEQRYRYASVGVTEEKDVPAVLLGKRNATFEIAGMEYERTAILKLPEKMNQTEFDTWKESGGIDLLDLFFHCIHQKSVRPESGSSSGSDAGPTDVSRSGEEHEESASGGENRTLTDGGSPSIPAEEIEHRCGEARKQLQILEKKVGENWLSGYLVSAIEEVDEAEEILKGEAPVAKGGEPVTDGGGGSCPSCGEEGEQLPELSRNLRACMNLDCRVNEFGVNSTATDGGSSMPKLALEHLKELKEVGDRLGELLSEMTGEELESFSDIYATEQSRPEANNEIELGDGFSLREAEYAELLGIIEQARAAAADDPIPLGVRNRILMNIILANPEEYARVKAAEMERRKEAQEAARQRFNEAVGRQRLNERMADLNDGVDIPIDGDEEENDA